MKSICLFLIFMIALPVQSADREPQNYRYYIYPAKDDYENSFSLFVLNPPLQSQPVVFYVLKNVESDSYINSATSIIKNGNKWLSGDFQSQPKFFITGIRFAKNANFTDSWDIPSYFIQWDNNKLMEKDALFRSLKLKKDFLSLPSSQLNRIITRAIPDFYSDDFVKFDIVHRKFQYSQIPVEEFLAVLLYELEKNEISMDSYPNIMTFKKLALENDGAPITFNDLISKNQKEKFNSDIVNWSAKLNFDEAQFILNEIIQNKINLANYYKLVKLMDKIQADYKNQYPEYFKYLYTLAWRREFRKPIIQEELSDAINSVYAKLSSNEDITMRKIILFNDALFKFAYGEITLADYKILGEGLNPDPAKTDNDRTKQIINRIRSIWTEFNQDKLKESLQVFYRYINLFKNDLNIIYDKLSADSSNIIIIIGEDKEIAPFLFWFSQYNTGPFIKTVPINKNVTDNLGTERYFELMKGERSHFEKMLEGISDE